MKIQNRLNRFCRLGYPALSAFLLSLPAHSAAVYTNRTAWEAAVLGVTTDTFDYTISAGSASITLPNGIVSTQVGNTVRPSSNAVTSGYFQSEIGNAFGVSTAIQWDFPTGIRAFGGDFNGFSHHGIRGNFDGPGNQTFSMPGAFSFFGVVGDATFSTITFLETDGNLGSSFQLDNASFATGVVPEPSSVILLASGLLGCLVLRRR